jgi:succinoglycan biosynthesis protein ExoM
MASINVCVCTCQRDQLLAQCLESVAQIELPPEAQVTVTVIDNDAGRSAEAVVNAIAPHIPVPLFYHCEPRRGIPFARNRAIEETHRLGSDYLVFIDDDEWVEAGWLKALFGFASSHDGKTVVSGDVIAELPADLPAEIRGLFKRKERRTGQLLESCATNNVIIPAYVTRELGLRFDETHPLAGGTDTIFFVEACARGVTILKCAEALVHESVPYSRANLRWLAQRKYRAGITEAWRKRRKGRSLVRVLISAGFLVVLESTKAAILALLGRKLARNKCWLKASKSAGVFMGAFGATVDSYQQITR